MKYFKTLYMKIMKSLFFNEYQVIYGYFIKDGFIYAIRDNDNTKSFIETIIYNEAIKKSLLCKS